MSAAFPEAGAAHGFDVSRPVGVGRHQVCLYGINTGQGSGNVLLGCSTVTTTAAAYQPMGALDEAARSGSTLTVRGWAFDPDQPTAASQVHVYVDGVAVAVLTAGADGRWSTSFAPTVQHHWYARSDGNATPVRATTVR